jgi:hypothetical protein
MLLRQADQEFAGKYGWSVVVGIYDGPSASVIWFD